MASIVESAAKIEQIREYNGSDLPFGSTYDPNYKKTTVLGKNENDFTEVNENDLVSPFSYKIIIRLDGKPVFLEDIQRIDPALRATRGMYSIRYISKKDKKYVKGRPFQIGQDMIRWSVKVSGASHWHYLCERVPELNWIDKYTTFSDKLFDFAAQHPGITFWFGIDFVRYAEQLEQQAGHKLERPFMAYTCSASMYRKLFKDKAALLRYYHEIYKEISEVEQLPAVQEEMQENSGETYVHGHNTCRDPETGRFIKKEKKE